MRETSVRKELMAELRQIYDNKDFVCGTSSILGYESARKKMLDFIRTAKEHRDVITSDNVLRLAMVFRDEEEKKRLVHQPSRKAKVAML